MENKKGAIELSISIIVIIVIGVTLLALGLVWIKGMFGKVESLTADAFETAEGQIGGISGVDSLLTLSPRTITLTKGSAKAIDVIIANLEEGTLTDIKAVVTGEDEDIDCLFADRVPKTSESKQYTIESGEQVKITLIVDEKGGNVGVKNCVIEVPGQTGDNSATLTINVEAKKGLFG